MELFQNHSLVRLKSCQEKYLVAEKDGASISQSRDGSTKNAHWMVEVVDEECICLKSCYGKYLTASNKPTIPGRRARMLKVTQSFPGRTKNSSIQWDSSTDNSNPGMMNSSLQWEPISNGYESQVRLKTRYGNYLQSNSGPAPLGNLVTHDLPKKTGRHNKKITWTVEVVEFPSEQWRETESIVGKLMYCVRLVVSEMNKGKEKIKDSMKDAKEMIKKQQTPVLYRNSSWNYRNARRK